MKKDASAKAYCARNGIVPHKFRKDTEALKNWDALLGLHDLCACGLTRIYIGHVAA